MILEAALYATGSGEPEIVGVPGRTLATTDAAGLEPFALVHVIAKVVSAVSAPEVTALPLSAVENAAPAFVTEHAVA